MMRAQRSSSKSALFLIELIIAIVFFALTSAICIQLFVRSHLLSTYNRDLNSAMNLAQSTVEQWKVTPDLYMGEDIVTSTRYFYDDDWGLVGDGEGWTYCMDVVCYTELPVSHLEVDIFKGTDEELLFLLDSSKYIGW